jgi:hypothetical protein
MYAKFRVNMVPYLEFGLTDPLLGKPATTTMMMIHTANRVKHLTVRNLALH